MTLADQLNNLRGQSGSRQSAPGSSSDKPRERKERTTPLKYLREVREELGKVSWPKRDEVVRGTINVIIISAVIGIIIGAFDLVSQLGLEKLLERTGAATPSAEETLPTDASTTNTVDLENLDLNTLIPEGEAVPTTETPANTTPTQ